MILNPVPAEPSPKKSPRIRKSKTDGRGQIRIGDQFNAISIIALSQSNPLKAIAEFVENSIDAQATNIRIIKGKHKGEVYIRIIDDGEGVRKNSEGEPDFKRVATHICDSIKRSLKQKGEGHGLQGEFGIGLLSFWTVGEELTLRSSGMDGRVYEMSMKRGEPHYEINIARGVHAFAGTELTISPLLPGLRGLSGEKLCHYLAQELRNRLLEKKINLQIFDYGSRKEFNVEPSVFEGRKVEFETPRDFWIQCELYLDKGNDIGISLYRNGTRVIPKITDLEEFQSEIWKSPYLKGFIEAPKLKLTPGSRLGILKDEVWLDFLNQMTTLEPKLRQEIEAQHRLEEEKASQSTLNSIEKALKNAMNFLPPEEYDWFPIYSRKKGPSSQNLPLLQSPEETPPESSKIDVEFQASSDEQPAQKSFFQICGPLHSIKLSSSNFLINKNSEKRIVARAYDRKGVLIEEGVDFQWHVLEGPVEISSQKENFMEVSSGPELGVARLKVVASEGSLAVEKEFSITVTDKSFGQNSENSPTQRGLPKYTFEFAPSSAERSRYSQELNLIYINSGHRDFKFVSQSPSQKLKYISKLFVKELLLINFLGLKSPEALERFVEMTTYMDT